MEKFYQWGTPEDLDDFNYWTKAINEIDKHQSAILEKVEIGLILAAGEGRRVQEVYKVPKPAIKIKGTQLWRHSRKAFSVGSHPLLVIQGKHRLFLEQTEDVAILELDKLTKGQADTAKIGIEQLNCDLTDPVTILSSDCVLPYNSVSKAEELIEDGADVVVWTAVGYPPASQSQNDFSWVSVENEEVKSALHKTFPKENLHSYELITGNFSFKSKALLSKMLDDLLKSESMKINEEFYLDSIIELALKQNLTIARIRIPDFISIGTLNEIKTYNYWNDNFLKVEKESIIDE